MPQEQTSPQISVALQSRDLLLTHIYLSKMDFRWRVGVWVSAPHSCSGIQAKEAPLSYSITLWNMKPSWWLGNKDQEWCSLVFQMFWLPKLAYILLVHSPFSSSCPLTSGLLWKVGDNMDFGWAVNVSATQPFEDQLQLSAYSMNENWASERCTLLHYWWGIQAMDKGVWLQN